VSRDREVQHTQAFADALMQQLRYLYVEDGKVQIEEVFRIIDRLRKHPAWNR
jgi:hypothetical protein